MTHAWLIIAHNEFEILQRLLSMLDSPNNDIYLHWDRKVKDLPAVRVNKSRFVVLSNRVDVRWGSVSQIECELALFEAAAANGPYHYYHVISGVTLPLRSQDAIDTYFQACDGKSVVTGLCQDTPYQEKLKVRRYNLFLHNYASSNQMRRKASQFLWKSAITLQRVLHIEANRGLVFYKASNWLSLTEEAVKYILGRKEGILKTYRWSFCGDEFFIPSELMASPLRQYILNRDDYLKREILRDTASTFHLSDYQALANGHHLFARKFTSMP